MGPQSKPDVVAVTGLSGSGKTTALNVFEDLGYHRIDNIPARLVPEILADPEIPHPLVLGFSPSDAQQASELIRLLDALDIGQSGNLIFVEATDDQLIRRYSESRRPHPFDEALPIRESIAQQRQILAPIREMAQTIIDTTTLSPHQLRDELTDSFGADMSVGMQINIQSFAYKNGLPRAADFVFDCRFLRNPHWDETLRPLDGRNDAVAAHVREDVNYDNFVNGIKKLLISAIPAIRKERRSYLTIAFGCSGGRHRSVAIAEDIHNRLAGDGVEAILQHRELTKRTVNGDQK